MQNYTECTLYTIQYIHCMYNIHLSSMFSVNNYEEPYNPDESGHVLVMHQDIRYDVLDPALDVGKLTQTLQVKNIKI